MVALKQDENVVKVYWPWPALRSKEEAMRVCSVVGTGWMYFWTISGPLSYYGHVGDTNMPIFVFADFSLVLLQSAVYAICGFLVGKKHSYAAAIVGLSVDLMNRIFTAHSGNLIGILIGALCPLLLIHAVRATKYLAQLPKPLEDSLEPLKDVA